MDEKTGSCEIILGNMGSGKTKLLIRKLEIEHDTGGRVLYINSNRDIRNTKNMFTTHNGCVQTSLSITSLIKTENLSDVNVTDYDLIGIDEAHFFVDLNYTVRKWVLEQKIDVIVAGLAGSSELELIGQITSLIPICAPGKLHILGGRCEICIKNKIPRLEAISGFTAAREKILSPDGIEVGGMETYISLCLKCYQKYRIKANI